MVNVEKTGDICGTIEEVFVNDAYYVTLYHYESPTDYEEAADFTSRYISMDTPKDRAFYKVTTHEKSRKKGSFGEIIQVVIGFFCVTKDTVWDMYINKRYRSDSVMDNIWEYICSIMPDNFNIRLFEGNFRDINWLIRSYGAKPANFDKLPSNYYKSTAPAVEGGMTHEHVFCRNLSQIILNFTKSTKTSLQG